MPCDAQGCVSDVRHTVVCLPPVTHTDNPQGPGGVSTAPTIAICAVQPPARVPGANSARGGHNTWVVRAHRVGGCSSRHGSVCACVYAVLAVSLDPKSSASPPLPIPTVSDDVGLSSWDRLAMRRCVGACVSVAGSSLVSLVARGYMGQSISSPHPHKGPTNPV